MGKNKSTKSDGVNTVNKTQNLDHKKRIPFGYYKGSGGQGTVK